MLLVPGGCFLLASAHGHEQQKKHPFPHQEPQQKHSYCFAAEAPTNQQVSEHLPGPKQQNTHTHTRTHTRTQTHTHTHTHTHTPSPAPAPTACFFFAGGACLLLVRGGVVFLRWRGGAFVAKRLSRTNNKKAPATCTNSKQALLLQVSLVAIG